MREGVRKKIKKRGEADVKRGPGGGAQLLLISRLKIKKKKQLRQIEKLILKKWKSL